MKILCKLGFHSYGEWGPTTMGSSCDSGQYKFNIRYYNHCNYDHKRWRYLQGSTYSEYGTDAKYKAFKESECQQFHVAVAAAR